jgi:hypothetical protein
MKTGIAILTALVVTCFVILQATRPQKARLAAQDTELIYLQGWADGFAICSGIHAGGYTNQQQINEAAHRLKTNFLARP